MIAKFDSNKLYSNAFRFGFWSAIGGLKIVALQTKTELLGLYGKHKFINSLTICLCEYLKKWMSHYIGHMRVVTVELEYIWFI